MSSLAHWCYRRKGFVLVAWLVALVGLAVAAIGVGAAFTTSADLPSSESSRAAVLLAQSGAGEGGAGAGGSQGRIVWQSQGVAVDDASVQDDVARMLEQVEALPGVEGVVSPYSDAGSAQIDTDLDTAFATVTTTHAVDVGAVQDVASSFDTATLQVAVGGQGLTEQVSPSGGTEAIGILAALVILLLVFRSGWAAALPIVTGVTGVASSLLTVMLVSHVIDLDSTSITMAALVGLGVGIDYALFIVNRHRRALMEGRSVEDAVAQAMTTSGRAVLFAGLTVIVGLVGMFVVGLGVLTGMGQAAAITVLFTVLAALTLLPALLGMLGLRVLSKKQRKALAAGEPERPGRSTRATTSSRWAGLLNRAPKRMAAVAIVLLAVLAIPALSIRVGDADASSDPAGSQSRQYFDLMAPAFGAGIDAPLQLVATIPDAAAADAFEDLTTTLETTPGVASVQVSPVEAGQTVAVATVVPTTSAQDQATQDLINDVRSDVIPAAEQGTDLDVLVGGQAASSIDMADALMGKLPLYLGLVAVLGFLILAVAFRSVVVPLVGAVTNLATLAVGFGVITAVFQLGWGSELLGVGSGAPITYIVPVILVGVMFGLSMDYQVFLVSRVHEEWEHTHDNRRAVRVGVAETGRVIATAATIMLCVFASFGFSGERIVSAIGIGLAISVVVDAFVVRLTLVPALMRLLGRANWWYPRWADRITPHVSIEGGDPTAARLEGPVAGEGEPEDPAEGVPAGIAGARGA